MHNTEIIPKSYFYELFQQPGNENEQNPFESSIGGAELPNLDLKDIERQVFYENIKLMKRNQDEAYQKKMPGGRVPLDNYKRLRGGGGQQQQVELLNEYRERFLDLNPERDIIKIIRENKKLYHQSSKKKRQVSRLESENQVINEEDGD